MLRIVLVAVSVAVTTPALAQAPEIGGLEVSPVGSDLAMLPALDETGCRVPMLIWRCRNVTAEVIYAFDMEIAAGVTPAMTVLIDGRPLVRDKGWHLSKTRRNALLPDPGGFTTAALAAQEVDFRLVDPHSSAELLDRFDLTGLVARLGDLPCALPE